MLKFILISLAALATVANCSHKLSDEFLDNLNAKTKTWKSGRNFHPNYPVKYLLGTLEDPDWHNTKQFVHLEDSYTGIPDYFDARVEWPNCTTIGEIKDQGSCASDWAVASVSTMSDRHCVAFNESVTLSAKEVITCCPICGFQCKGGYTRMAWQYWMLVGLATGGDYNTTDSCQPYHIAPCEHFGNATGLPQCDNKWHLAMCKFSCIPEYTKKTFKEDHHVSRSFYRIQNSERQIQLEIMRNGPVSAIFQVHEDFLSYKSGIYTKTVGDKIGWHTVKIIGWGTDYEGGVNTGYWLVANSWNSGWGMEGYFKILRGMNHLKIEQYVMAGTPYKPMPAPKRVE